MKKISLKTRKFMATILALVLVLTMFMVSSKERSTVSALNGTPNQDVSNLLTNINVNITSLDGTTKYVEDNTGILPMYNGSFYSVNISWNIAEDNFRDNIEEGDYFWLDISNNYFAFSNSLYTNDLVYEGVTIGSWKIQDNKIFCEFSKEAEEFLHVYGYFEAEGSLTSTVRDNVTVTLGGVPIEIEINPITEGFPYKDESGLSDGGNPLDKYGIHYKGHNDITWHILVNYSYASKHYLGDTVTTAENAVVKDTLPEDLIIEDLIISTPINHPMNETTLTSKEACQIDLSDQFEIKNESDFASATEWEDYINTHKKSFGISNNQKTFIANLGDLPGSLSMSDTKDNFKDTITQLNLKLSDEEKNALADIYYNDSTNPYPVYAVNITLKTKSDSVDGILQQDSYSNSASLTTTNFDPQNASTLLEIEKMEAGIVVSIPKTVILIKKDYDSNETISGASFKLQKLKGTVWEDYVPISGTPIKNTDSEGKIVFDNLGTGTYRFVETSAADGYDLASIEYSVSEFTITDEQVAPIEITATNKRIRQETTEESTTPVETTEEGTTPVETTEEATTPVETIEESTTEKYTEEVTTEEITTTEKYTEETTTKEKNNNKSNEKELDVQQEETVTPIKTSDNTNTTVWYMLAILAVCTITIFTLGKRKENSDEQ